MKKIISIFLLTVFLFDLFGYFPLFKYAQFKIQKEIKMLLKKSVPDDELYVIAVPTEKVNELDWKREGKEFRHKGKMYDIVKYEINGDTIHYYCVNDTQETQLFAHLEEIVNKQIDNGKSPMGKTAKNFLKIFGSLKYIPSGNFAFLPDNSSHIGNSIYSFFYSPVYIEILTPPPNQVV